MNRCANKNLQPLEKALVVAFVKHNLILTVSLENQFSRCVVSHREFTGGGGAFISFAFSGSVIGVPRRLLAGYRNVGGDDIQSEELELEASSDFILTEEGVVDHLEIQALANDYPFVRQPESFLLVS